MPKKKTRFRISPYRVKSLQPEAGAQFGAAVGVGPAGLAVGAPRESFPNWRNFDESGAVSVYR